MSRFICKRLVQLVVLTVGLLSTRTYVNAENECSNPCNAQGQQTCCASGYQCCDNNGGWCSYEC
jgi:hypothetical protein